MSTPQRRQMRVLMRVFCEDWFCLTTPDEPVIETLLTTGHLALQDVQPGRHLPRLRMTPDGIAYLGWMLTNDPVSNESPDPLIVDTPVLPAGSSPQGKTVAP